MVETSQQLTLSKIMYKKEVLKNIDFKCPECQSENTRFENGYCVCTQCGLVTEHECEFPEETDSYQVAILQSNGGSGRRKTNIDIKKPFERINPKINRLVKGKLTIFPQMIHKIYHTLRIFESYIPITHAVTENINYYLQKLLDIPNIVHHKQWYIILKKKDIKGFSTSELIVTLFYFLYFKKKRISDNLDNYLGIIRKNRRPMARHRFMAIKEFITKYNPKLTKEIISVNPSNNTDIKTHFYQQLDAEIKRILNKIEFSKFKSKQSNNLFQYTNIKQLMYTKIVADLKQYPYFIISQRSIKTVIAYLFWHNLQQYLKNGYICHICDTNGSAVSQFAKILIQHKKK